MALAGALVVQPEVLLFDEPLSNLDAKLRGAVTALGRDMTVAAYPEVRANAATYLMVRPETLSLTAAPEGGIGSVLRATFHGHSVDYEVETGAGPLAVAVPGPDPQWLLAEGTNVTVGIDPARAYVLVKS